MVVLPATSTFGKSNKRFSVSQTPSVSSSKVEDIEEGLPKKKESISRDRVIDVLYVPYLVSRFFGEMVCLAHVSAVH